MSSWRDQLCGSKALGELEEDDATIQQLLHSNEMLSCGGAFFPVSVNQANMNTFRSNFILPTEKYSVLVFGEEGNAIIYSEEDYTKKAEEEEDSGFFE